MRNHIRRAAITAFGTLLISTGFAQLTLTDEGVVVLDTIGTVEMTSTEVLYERAKEWMLRNLKSSDSQILLDDVAKTNLVGTANLLLPGKDGPSKSVYTDRVLNFKLSVSVKEDRYRVIAENIVYSYVFNRGVTKLPVRQTAEELFTYLGTVESKGSPKSVAAAREPIDDLDEALAGMLRSLQAFMRGERELMNGDW